MKRSLQRFTSFLAACGFAPARRIGPSRRSRERPKMTRIALMIVLLLACVGLIGCGGTKTETAPTDPMLEQRFDAARAAFEQGSYPQAARLFQQAADRAYLRDDPQAAADALISRAICLMRMRQFDRAAEALDDAAYAALLSGDRMTGDVTLLRSWLALERDQPDAAVDAARRVLAANPAVKRQTQAHAIIGLVAVQQSDLAAAEAALAAMGRPTSINAQADRARLTGAIARLRGDHESAAEAFEREVEWRRSARSYFAMARALANAAEARAELGQLEAAGRLFFRAGRSAAEQGALVEARDWLSRAADLADRAGDAPTAQAARAELAAITGND